MSLTEPLTSEYQDMSDVAEARRWADSVANNPGLGDAIYDDDDAAALRSIGAAGYERD